jgi:FAD/FMN-containing dehydrogenase
MQGGTFFIDDLKKNVAGEVLTDDATLAEYSKDYSLFEVRPLAVACPKSADDVKALVRFANGRASRGEPVTLTGRSAGTDMSGGPLTESVVVSFTQHMNQARELADDHVVVEPGMYFRDLEKLLAERGVLYPSYPASKDLCAVGGMVMNNSGGEKTLAYGQTKDYVRSVRIVLADGEEHVIQPLSGSALQAKLAEQSYEGDIYRRVHTLVTTHHDAIQKARPNVSKNSTGYLLWDVWDPKTGTFDLTKLIVGSQGTLGLLTAADLRLVPVKKHSRLLVIFARSLEPIPAIVEAALGCRPESIESYDDRTLGLAFRFLPQMLWLMKGNLIRLGFSFLPEAWMFVKGGFRYPKMVLLVSVTGDDEHELDLRINELRRAIVKFPVVSRVVKSAEEAEKYWTIRRQSFKLLHSNVRGKYAAPFVDDIIVDPVHMPEFLPKVNAILDRYGKKFIYTIAGHPGNGNFHIIPLVDLKDPETRKLIPQVTEEIYKLTVEYGGSISGEHNDGLIRTPYLALMYSPEILKLFAEVKKIFDPENIFNPGKKVGATKEYAAAHMRKG